MQGRGFLTVAVVALALAGCTNDNGHTFQGWVEADTIFVSADESGRVELLQVRQGDRVEKGALLFTVDDDLQQADLMLRKAILANAQQNYNRAKDLLNTTAGTQKAYDDNETALRQANASLATSETHLARRNVFSPAEGSVQRIYFRPGETVGPGLPVIALLPPENIKIRFFVPEALLPEIGLGKTMTVFCDGCEKSLTAKVSFIASTAEFTPPVIYSLDERAKLVFLIEALPEKPEKFHVGQPVTVLLPSETPQ
jgi:HlyD family secretion protein